MNPGPAGLFLRASRVDPGLQLLATVLDRALATTAGTSFASLFVDLRRGAAAQAVPALVERLRAGGRLADDAEVTLHMSLATLHAVPSLIASSLADRLAIRDPTPAPAALDALAGRARLGVEIGPAKRLTEPGLVQAWLDRGVGHLGLGALQGEAAGQARDLLAEAAALGFRRYEAANWASPGHEARWLLAARAGAPFLALGPDAYGRWPSPDGWSWWRSPAPGPWRRLVDRGEDGRGRRHCLPPLDRARERLIDGLHLAEGVDLPAIAAETGLPIATWLDEPALARAIAQGHLLPNQAATHHLRAADLDHVDLLLATLLR